MNNPGRFSTSSLLLIVLFSSCGKKTEIIHPEYRTITEAVYASGNLFPLNEYKVAANADGFLTQRLVNPGDKVELDQLMFVIENDLQQIRASNSAEIYKKARENYGDNSAPLTESKLAIESAKDKYRNDSTNYARYQRLVAKDAVSKVDFDKARLAFELSSNELKQRKDSYLKLKNQLFVDLQQAETTYQINFKDASNCLVKAKIPGEVFEVLKEQGEVIRRNEPIAILGDGSRSYLKLQVDELDIKQIKIGQKVLIKLDVDKNSVYQGKVTKVYPKLNIEDQSFRVDAEFIGKAPQQLYGLTLEANIILHEASKKLTLPKTALIGNDSVWVKIDGDERKIKIQKGAENFDYFEITAGLTESSEVLIK